MSSSTTNSTNTNTNNQIALIDWEEKGTLKLNQKLSEFVAQIQQMQDVSPNGDYLGIVDPTAIANCIPRCETLDDMSDDTLRDCIVPVEFEDGLPTIGGVPIWERLDGEPIPYYKIFKEYRDMKFVNISMNHSTTSYTQIGNRSIGRLGEVMGVSGRLLNILSKIYHWPMRVKAFDVFKIREISLRKQFQAEELECKHAKYSNDLLEQAITYLKDHPAQLNPKTALQMVELGMKYGRISVGLAGDKPGSNGTAVHQTNINVSQTNNSTDQVLNVQTGAGNDSNGSKGSAHGSEIERRLSNDMKDSSNLMSVLHVLNKSGAFNVIATEQNKLANSNINSEDNSNSDNQTPFDEGDDFSHVIDIVPLQTTGEAYIDEVINDQEGDTE